MGYNMSLNVNTGSNEDFKYEMNDLTVLYYGAKYTFQDILDDPNGSFKVKKIIRSYLGKDLSPETTLESLFYYMRPGDEAYMVFEQLKTKIRLSVPVTRKKLFGGTERIYKEEVWKLADLAALAPEEKQRRGILIQEIQISKLGLMTFTV